MNDHDRNGKIYQWAVIAAGCAIALHSIHFMVTSTGWEMEWFALMAVAAFLTARGGIKLPQINSLLTVSDALIFLSVLMCGVHPAAVLAAFEAAVVSFLYTKQKIDRLFNMSCMAVSTYASGSFVLRFFGNFGTAFESLFVPLGVLALLQYIGNSVLVAVALGYRDRLNARTIWRENLFWTSISYFLGAIAAGAVYLAVAKLGFYSLFVALPILLITFFSYKTYVEKVETTNEHASKMASLYQSTLESLTMAIDAKDQVTHGHVRRVQVYALALAEALGHHSHAEIEGLKAASLLHDIGKLAVPEHILNKPTGLTSAEFSKIQAHPTIGAQILANVDFPYPVVPLVLHHHERWDGTGYPLGLKGEDIPFGARILAVADCYDALRSNRPYRRGFSIEKSLEIMRNEAGRSLDPSLVEEFVRVAPQAERKLAEAERRDDIYSFDELNTPQLWLDRRAHPGGEGLASANSVYLHIAAAHREVLALYEISQTLGSTLNVAEVLSLVSSTIGKIVEFDSGVIFLADEEDQSLTASHVIGEDASFLLNRQLRFGEGLAGWAAMHREPVVNAVPRIDFESLQFPDPEKYKRSLIYPLIDKGKLLGVLGMYSVSAMPYSADQVRMMEVVSKHAATALSNSLVFEETQETALTDRLTGLPNSRYMYLFFEQELMKAEKHNYPITLVMMDLDGFKRINDQYGHHVGDDLLREIAATLSNQIRREDILVRYAGDEFVAVLIGTTPEQTEEIQQRIQESVDGAEVETRKGRKISAGISTGKAIFPQDGRTLEELMIVADADMYRNKEERKMLAGVSLWQAAAAPPRPL